MRPTSRAAVPLVALPLALALAAVEAAQVVVTSDAAVPRPYLEVLGRILPAWALLGVMAPAVAWAVRRWRLDFRPRSLALHGTASALFALVHALALAGVKVLRGAPDVTFGTALQSSLFYNFVADLLVYWLIAAAVQALGDAAALRRQEAAALELKARLAEARLEALRSQLQPHFLHNVLNGAAMLAREGRAGEVVVVLARLGELLRYLLRPGAGGDAPLGEELDFLRRYLELEQVRFSDRLEVTFELDPALAALPVPSLLLQPLVENAIRHGVAARPGASRLAVRVGRRGGVVELEVRDDGPGLSATPRAGGLGLRNTRDRLAQRYGDAARLTVETLPEGGARALVTLPWGAAA